VIHIEYRYMINMDMHIHIYIYIDIYVDIYMYICIYVYIHQQNGFDGKKLQILNTRRCISCWTKQNILKEPTNCSHPMPSSASSSILRLCKRLLTIQGFTVLNKSILRSISAGTVVIFNTRFPFVRLDAQINNTQITLNEEASP